MWKHLRFPKKTGLENPKENKGQRADAPLHLLITIRLLLHYHNLLLVLIPLHRLLLLFFLLLRLATTRSKEEVDCG